MIIALDYDGTYTKDPELWDKFIELFQNEGHRVAIVTMRYDIPSEWIDNVKVPVIYTGRKAKKPFLNADIWIDDTPHYIYQDAL